jgi:hypothetical protein
VLPVQDTGCAERRCAVLSAYAYSVRGVVLFKVFAGSSGAGTSRHCALAVWCRCITIPSLPGKMYSCVYPSAEASTGVGFQLLAWFSRVEGPVYDARAANPVKGGTRADTPHCHSPLLQLSCMLDLLIFDVFKRFVRYAGCCNIPLCRLHRYPFGSSDLSVLPYCRQLRHACVFSMCFITLNHNYFWALLSPQASQEGSSSSSTRCWLETNQMMRLG